MLESMMADVLVVEDEEDIAVPLVHTLEREGYVVARAATGAEAIQRVSSAPPAAVILDLGLPDMDGIDVCRALRADGYTGGIIMVTGRAGELDRVVGLDVGADDYLVKPFGLAELQARVRALLRRSSVQGGGEATSVTTSSGLSIDAASRRVQRDGVEIALTAKEFDVLALLASHLDKVVPRDVLMNQVWDENWFGSTKTLDVTIGRLRNKLEGAGVVDRVVAIRGVGFRLETDRS